MKVCVYAICKNESQFVERWMASMGEADAVVVLDTGSTDDTVERLRAAGARVTVERFDPWRFDTARNRSLDLVPEDADICVCTDLDEVLHPGWRALLEAAWAPGTTRATYRYTWNFLPDGREGHVFWYSKVHARHGYRWTHPVHEVLTPDPGLVEHVVTVQGMQLDHHADESKSRAQYLPLLELSVQEDPEDDRNMHYLGREYMFRGQWEKAIATLKRHLSLPRATWRDERCASMRFLARCCQAMGQEGEAESWLWRAAGEAPYLREPWVELAALLYQKKDMEGTAYCAGRALAITERPRTYITEGSAWGSQPADLRSLGLYYTGRKEEALTYAKQASALEPENRRLRDNAELIARELQVTSRSMEPVQLSPSTQM